MNKKYDWENAGPTRDSLEALLQVEGEDTFPMSYSGQAWRAAYRIWKVAKDDPSILDIGPYHLDRKGVDLYNLGLSGFQVGWALNAIRQMLDREPGPNPAIVTIGVKDEPPYPSRGSAESDMKQAIGGADETE